jgi:hypothetical protein
MRVRQIMQAEKGGIGGLRAGERMMQEEAASHGGMHGLMSGSNAQMLGDMLDQVTGHRGWVFRLRGLNQGAGALGGAIPEGMGAALGIGAGTAVAAAAMMVKGQMAVGKTRDDTRALDRAMGLTTGNPLSENAATRGLIRLLPRSMQPDIESGTRGIEETESAGGMASQRQAIQEAMTQAQGSRGYWARYGNQFSPHDRIAESFASEIAAQDKLNELDVRSAELVGKQMAARRAGVYEGERAGKAAQIQVALEEKLADLVDQQRSGKIGVAEYASRVRDAQSQAAEETFDNQRKAAAEDRSVSYSRDLTYLRSTGKDIEVRSARSRLGEANENLTAAISPEEKRAAQGKVEEAQQDYNETVIQVAARQKIAEIEKSTADFRGSAEERSMQAADARVKAAQTARDYAITDVEWMEKDKDLSAAVLAQEQNRLDLAEKRIAMAGQIARGEMQVQLAAERAALAPALYGPSLQMRFLASQKFERDQASEKVSAAQSNLDDANAKVAAEIADPAHGGKADEETIEAQILAQQELNKAKSEEVEINTKLTAESKEHAYQMGRELAAMEVETAAMRMQNSGRSDLAQLATMRSQDEQKAQELDRQGGSPDQIAAAKKALDAAQDTVKRESYWAKPEDINAADQAQAQYDDLTRPHQEAQQVREQEHEKEVGMIDDMYLNPDGRKKRRSQVNDMLRKRRRTQRRRDAFNAQLEANDGLMNVHRDSNGRVVSGTDPLTGEVQTPEQHYARQHPAQASTPKGAGKTTQDLWDLLNSRLPGKVAK